MARKTPPRGLCKYCLLNKEERPAIYGKLGMCGTHYDRYRRRFSERNMRRPIRKWSTHVLHQKRTNPSISCVMPRAEAERLLSYAPDGMHKSDFIRNILREWLAQKERALASIEAIRVSHP